MARVVSPLGISTPLVLADFYREEFQRHRECLARQREYYSERAITDADGAIARILNRLEHLCAKDDADTGDEHAATQVRRRDRPLRLVRPEELSLTTSVRSDLRHHPRRRAPRVQPRLLLLRALDSHPFLDTLILAQRRRCRQGRRPRWPTPSWPGTARVCGRVPWSRGGHPLPDAASFRVRSRSAADCRREPLARGDARGAAVGRRVGDAGRASRRGHAGREDRDHARAPPQRPADCGDQRGAEASLSDQGREAGRCARDGRSHSRCPTFTRRSKTTRR